MARTPRRRLGQHFLHDPAVVERIVAAVAPAPGDRIVEIGPGDGVLTAPLLRAAGELDAVEVDRDLAAALRARDDWPGELRVHGADALGFDFAGLAGDAGLRLVGNLPYNVSTPLLFRLLGQRRAIADMHFMLQREVGDRIVAAPASRAYGRLSVMIQAHCRAERLFRVGPGAFRPRPAVESAVLRLVPLAASAVAPADAARFAELVRLAFAARRKTLRNALRPRLTAEAIAAAGIDPGTRAERLAVADFARLAAATRGPRQPSRRDPGA